MNEVTNSASLGSLPMTRYNIGDTEKEVDDKRVKKNRELYSRITKFSDFIKHKK